MRSHCVATLILFIISFGIAKTKLANVVVVYLNGTSSIKNLTPGQKRIFPDVETLFNVQGKEIIQLEIHDTFIEALRGDQLMKFPLLESLTISGNKRLKKIEAWTFTENEHLDHLILQQNSLGSIHNDAFVGLFRNENMKGKLDLSFNNLQHMPSFSEVAPGLKTLIIDDNPIKIIHKNSFANLTHLEKLSIRGTGVKELPNELFLQKRYLYSVDFSNNQQLEYLPSKVFVGATNLRIMNLSNTKINKLPYNGLERLEKLLLRGTPNLWEIPDGIIGIPTLRKVQVAMDRPWLCCAFSMKRSVMKISDHKISNSSIQLLTTSATTVDTTKYTERTDPPFNGFNEGRKRRNLKFGFFTSASNTTQSPRDLNKSEAPFIGFTFKPPVNRSNITTTGKDYNPLELHPVDCAPKPDALRPCDDIMGNVFLASFSWLFSILALFGNALVFCVLVLSRRSVTVTKFLLINLSFADLCLALYLFILVSASTHTHGVYYNYVREWQYEGGCSIAGFLAIFSSQLSMLVLLVVTMERYFAIVYAMHFNRRLSMNNAMICMVCAWLISLVMAVLPLVGVNSYTNVAICLPFSVATTLDLSYIGFLLFFNIILFLLVSVAYWKMFLVVRSPRLDNRNNRNDSEVAKRMALLIFTDFFCWVPIAIVGLLSVFGDAETIGITVKNSKFLLVIFFPINALCNPYLYSVSTSSFKRDFYDLLIRCGIFRDYIARVNERTLSGKNHNNSLNRQLTTSTGRLGLLARALKIHTRVDNNNSQYSTATLSIASAPNTPVINSGVLKQGEDESIISPFISKNEHSQASKETLGINQDIGDNENTKETRCSIVNENFSEYDLSPESFRRVKKTTRL